MGSGRSRGVFVTGTDTGVGKTFVSCALARALARRGVRVGVMKPVASGCRRHGGSLISEDAEELLAASGSGDRHEEVCPLRFAAPLGPSVAARLERRRVRMAPVMAAFGRLRRRHQFLIVEGVGGLAVPLSARSDVAGLARRLRLPLLVVAADRLGVLNHTVLTLEYARRAGLEVRGVVLNRPRAGGDSSRRSNAAELRRRGVPLLTVLGHCRSPRGAAGRLAALARRLFP
jgi:dethiobiotin synthetase